VDVHAWDAEQMDEEPPSAEEQQNVVERALTTVLKLTGLLKVAELLHDRCGSRASLPVASSSIRESLQTGIPAACRVRRSLTR
jgi:hypothetical protein